MNTNSLNAYRSLIEPNLTNMELEVFVKIKEFQPISCAELAEKIGRLPHQISGRFTGLKEKQKIKVFDRIKIGKTNHDRYMVVPKEVKQLELF